MSKSKYCKGVQCPKILWMDTHMTEVKEDVASEAIFRTGKEVGELAREYFGEHALVEFGINKQKMCQDTKDYIKRGNRVIAEASFKYQNNFCSVDILRITEAGVELIEVKSSTEIHDIYYDDMAYQYYVLSHCGINVTGVFNMHINNEYVRRGELNLHELFELEDCTEKVLHMQGDIEHNLDGIWTCVESIDEPKKELAIYCDKPYECAYKKYCHRNIMEPSVFSIHRLSASKKYELYSQGIVSLEDVVREKPQLSEKQWRQVNSTYYNEMPTIEKEEILEFLGSLTYPLYHLDFETYQQAIPQFDGVKPYMQIPFQYSLHVQRELNGQLEHCEFLGKEGTDPRRALAEQLCEQIPMNVCSLAFNMSFEKTVIKNLAEAYEDLSEHLMNIHNNMHDLMVPFQKQNYYCTELHGSYSIKFVLPALCAKDPELDYHALDGIHNGSEAMNAFADLPNHSTEEIEEIRKNLLAYCRLDTMAMVKILEKLYIMTGLAVTEKVSEELQNEGTEIGKNSMAVNTNRNTTTGSDKVAEIFEDIIVVKKIVEILNILYGEGTKAQVEKMLVSDLEDEFYEKYEKSLNDKLYNEQRHRVRNALITSGILFYDEKIYKLLIDEITQEHFDKIQNILESKTDRIDTTTEKQTDKQAEYTEGGTSTDGNALKNKEFDMLTQEEEFKSYVLNLVRNMEPFEFERLTTKILRSCGLEFYPGNRTGDDGVDGYGYLEVAGLFKFKVLVQCKRYQENNKIANYAIRDLRGAVSTDAYKGLFVTTSSFSPRAKQEAEKFPQIDMIDGRQFVDLMLEKKVGIIEQDGKYSIEKDYLKHIELEEIV